VVRALSTARRRLALRRRGNQLPVGPRHAPARRVHRSSTRPPPRRRGKTCWRSCARRA